MRRAFKNISRVKKCEEKASLLTHEEGDEINNGSRMAEILNSLESVFNEKNTDKEFTLSIMKKELEK